MSAQTIPAIVLTQPGLLDHRLSAAHMVVGARQTERLEPAAQRPAPLALLNMPAALAVVLDRMLSAVPAVVVRLVLMPVTGTDAQALQMPEVPEVPAAGGRVICPVRLLAFPILEQLAVTAVLHKMEPQEEPGEQPERPVALDLMVRAEVAAERLQLAEMGGMVLNLIVRMAPAAAAVVVVLAPLVVMRELMGAGEAGAAFQEH